ncbi:MAG: transposase [Anaerolineae bacterium]|nr:transposase [Anaerolineae bacterium]
MSKQKHTPEQIVRILREAETTDEPVEAFCRRKEISTVSYYRWRAKYGGLDVSEAKRLKDLEQENARLKKLLADVLLANDGLKEFLAKKN